MKYGTPTRIKKIYPFLRSTLDNGLSPLAKRRLKWMLYIWDGHCVAQCSRHFDIPLRTLWYWVRRFDINKPHSLENKSTKPKHVRYSTVPLHERKRVIQLRRKYPSWGKLKIQRLLQKEGTDIGQSRIQKIINQSGLKRTRMKKSPYRRANRRHMYSVPPKVRNVSGGLVYFDVKHLSLQGGKKGYQFTAIDHATRRLVAKVYSSITSRNGRAFFLYVKNQLGSNAISYVGSDNGSEFLGLFEEGLSEHGVTHVFSSPRSPKQNPFVERVIKTIIEEVYWYNGLETDVEKQQEVLDKYIFTYNKIRPHRSLNLDTPFERYVKLSKSQAM